jgi:hypothetical protein
MLRRARAGLSNRQQEPPAGGGGRRARAGPPASRRPGRNLPPPRPPRARARQVELWAASKSLVFQAAGRQLFGPAFFERWGPDALQRAFFVFEVGRARWGGAMWARLGPAAAGAHCASLPEGERGRGIQSPGAGEQAARRPREPQLMRGRPCG